MSYKFNDPELYLELLKNSLTETKGELILDKRERQHLDVLLEMHGIFKRKNEDYGDSFSRTLDRRGLLSALIQMEHKMSRFDEIVESGITVVEDEYLEDTLMDLANYAVMVVMWLREKEAKKIEDNYSKNVKRDQVASDSQGRWVDLYSDEEGFITRVFTDNTTDLSTVSPEILKQLPLNDVDRFGQLFEKYGEDTAWEMYKKEKEDMEKIYNNNNTRRESMNVLERLVADTKEGICNLFGDAHLNSHHSINPYDILDESEQLTLDLYTDSEEEKCVTDNLHPNFGRDLEQNCRDSD